MKILALDLAIVTGFAIGEAGSIPRSGSVRLKRSHEGIEQAALNLRQFLREQIFTFDHPDLVAIEAYIRPAGHRNNASAEYGVALYCVAAAEILARGVRLEKFAPSTVRAHFIGQANKGARQETKNAVVHRAQLLGYIPFGCADDNRADACAVFDYAAVHVGHVPPKSLVMFGEGAQ